MENFKSNAQKELDMLCLKVKQLIEEHNYEDSEILIEKALAEYPHAPEPHNLFGILLEKTGEHLTAMKHFRAALSLDPTYLPAEANLDHFGNLYSKETCSYGDSDSE